MGLPAGFTYFSWTWESEYIVAHILAGSEHSAQSQPGTGPRAQPRNLACLRKSCFLYLAEALPQPPWSAAALDQLPCAQGALRIGASKEPTVALRGHTGFEVSSHSAHTISCSWGCFMQWPAHGQPHEPISCQALRHPLSQELPWLWAPTLLGTATASQVH